VEVSVKHKMIVLAVFLATFSVSFVWAQAPAKPASVTTVATAAKTPPAPLPKMELMTLQMALKDYQISEQNKRIAEQTKQLAQQAFTQATTDAEKATKDSEATLAEVQRLVKLHTVEGYNLAFNTGVYTPTETANAKAESVKK
jgi:flagellar biosynthesis component FlhA